MFTYWFETSSSKPIDSPPLLHRTCRLEVGDLFLHRSPGSVQIWLRMGDEEDDEEDEWEEIEEGYERSVDGRRLTLTPTRQMPSWVGGDWGSRRVAARKYTSFPTLSQLFGMLTNSFVHRQCRGEVKMHV